MLVFN